MGRREFNMRPLRTKLEWPTEEHAHKQPNALWPSFRYKLTYRGLTNSFSFSSSLAKRPNNARTEKAFDSILQSDIHWSDHEHTDNE